MQLFHILFGSSLIIPSLSAAIQPRQIDTLANIATWFFPSTKTIKVEQLAVKTSTPGAKRARITYGPWALRAANDKKGSFGNMKSMDPTGTAYLYNTDKDFPKNITVLENHASITYENGSRADASTGVYTHHLFFADITKNKIEPLVCKENRPSFSFTNPFSLNAGAPISVFVGTAEDDAILSFVSTSNEFKTGYYIASNDRVVFSGDLVNYRNFTQSVFVTIEIEYLDGKPSNFVDTAIATINVGMCNGTSGLEHPPEGLKRWTVQSKEMTAMHDIRFMNLAGHLHDGGVNIEMSVNGKQICTSDAVYGSTGEAKKHEHGAMATNIEEKPEPESTWQTIKKMTTCPNHVDVKKGDTVNVQAHYDLEKHPQRMQMDGGMAEEMAIIGGTFFALPKST